MKKTAEGTRVRALNQCEQTAATIANETTAIRIGNALEPDTITPSDQESISRPVFPAHHCHSIPKKEWTLRKGGSVLGEMG
jgi:hypothetical protein